MATDDDLCDEFGQIIAYGHEVAPLRDELVAVTAERDRYWQALVDIDGYEGWQARDVPAAKAMGDIARVALGRDRPEPEHDCEAELKSRPDYSACMGTPAVFDCSCGKRYAYGSEESEGAAWDLVEPAEDAAPA